MNTEMWNGIKLKPNKDSCGRVCSGRLAKRSYVRSRNYNWLPAIWLGKTFCNDWTRLKWERHHFGRRLPNGFNLEMLVKHCHLQDAEDVARAEDIRCESVSLFHLFYRFINSSGTFWSCFGVGVLLFGGCLFVLFFCLLWWWILACHNDRGV